MLRTGERAFPREQHFSRLSGTKQSTLKTYIKITYTTEQGIFRKLNVHMHICMYQQFMEKQARNLKKQGWVHGGKEETGNDVTIFSAQKSKK